MHDHRKLRIWTDLLRRRLRNRNLLRDKRGVRGRYLLRRANVRSRRQPESQRAAEHMSAMLLARTKSLPTDVRVRRGSEVLRELPGQ